MKTTNTYSKEQIRSTRKLTDALMDVPEKKRPIISAMATAYIDGISAGVIITDAEIKEA